MTVLEAAIAYRLRGWFAVPIPHRSKNPGYRDWEKTRLAEADLPQHFNGQPQNIGILLGEPSQWTVDVDLDHARCVALADQFLPTTPAVFGRPGKPRSHRIYRVSAPIVSKKHKSKSAGMLVELRSTGLQTVFPPSTHESGEAITWETDGSEPALVDPVELLEAVERLANAVRMEIGEKSPPKLLRKSETHVINKLKQAATKASRTSERIRACVASMLRMQIHDHNDGSGRLFAAACRTVEHDLDDGSAIAAIREYARQLPFPKEWTDDEIIVRVRDAEKKTERGVIRRADCVHGKVKIVIDHEEYRVATETIAAISADDTIYQRGNVLVRIIRDAPNQEIVQRSPGSASIAFLPQACLRERMTKYAQFTKFVKRRETIEEILTHPTPWLVAAVDARGDWSGIRPLKGISEVPVLRPDGTLWQTAGYDHRTGVLYEPSGEFPIIHEEVDIDDAHAAVGTLFDVVCDFPFETDDHRSAWLAGLLTPFARFAFDGPTPLFLVDANIRGAGKGLLVQTIGQIVSGYEMPVSSYAHDFEEMRKKITAIALAGDRMIHLDNLEGNFGNDTLDRALTATRWKDRILGKSQQVDLPLIPIWYGTGNNVAVAADTTRRVIHIRLDVLEERPEERTGFVHPDLIGYVKQHRGQLVACAFTILRAYYNAGCPRQNLTSYGSFEGWSRLVREAIVWAGQPDPCNTRQRLVESSDTTADSLAQLVRAWPGYDPFNQGIVVSDILSRLYAKEFAPRDEASDAMRAALENLVGCPPGRVPSARQVGAKFKAFRRRVISGMYIDTNDNENHRNGAVWRLQRA